jgi:membrane associated rhomboid family serine protease
MLFPIGDDDREVQSVSYVTYALLVANVLVFFLQMANPTFTYGWSIIPKEITTGQDLVEPQPISVPGGVAEVPQAPGPPIIWFTLISAMFMHGGYSHIGGNMLYLWIFGNNVEERFGHVRFLIFYLTSGIIGSLAQIAVGPQSVIPNLGASGAISGIMGAYLVLFPHNRVNAVFLYQVITVPAIVVLGMWIVTQLASGYGSIASTSASTGGVAYLAHIGGFVAGAVIGGLVRMQLKQEPDSVLYRQYQRDPQSKLWW